MWQTKYAAAIPKNLGVGVNFWPCSEGYFLSGPPQSVGNKFWKFLYLCDVQFSNIANILGEIFCNLTIIQVPVYTLYLYNRQNWGFYLRKLFNCVYLVTKQEKQVPNVSRYRYTFRKEILTLGTCQYQCLVFLFHHKINTIK